VPECFVLSVFPKHGHNELLYKKRITWSKYLRSSTYRTSLWKLQNPYAFIRYSEKIIGKEGYLSVLSLKFPKFIFPCTTYMEPASWETPGEMLTKFIVNNS
jgi:hypothetical protein